MFKTKNKTPLDGLAGLQENYASDAISGFIVFLLALPLSLGLAKASDFPPIMGLVSAIIGGVLVSFFSGSKLTIKGPAAGLIVIVAGAVAEFGKGNIELGWHLALGTMVFAGVFQIVFGLLKFGKIVDFFPLSVIKGMLAAIGLIILFKQIPVLICNNTELAKNKSPLELFVNIPKFIVNIDLKTAFIGIVSLLILLFWNRFATKHLKKIPAPLVVLFFAIPSEMFLKFNQSHEASDFIKVGNIIETINVNVNFSGISQTWIFIKYVLMFAIVGSVESLMTVKAIDLIDPYKRKSNTNKDLIAVGIGNVVAAVFGALPIISEVARSTSNVSNGAKTRWANFFHGFFVLLFLLLGAQYLELIPNAAFAAMLISVAIKLASPDVFFKVLKIGKEQLIVFLVTIFFSLLEDLLVGIIAGIVVKILMHLYMGVSFSSLFKSKTASFSEGNNYYFKIQDVAIFSNFFGIKKKLEQLPEGLNIKIDLKETFFVDHSVMESLFQFKKEYNSLENSQLEIVGLENHRSLSSHKFSARKNANSKTKTATRN